MTRTFHGVDEFRRAAWEELGTSPRFEMTLARIDAFANVTEDWQWIHVKPDRAAASDLGRTVHTATSPSPSSHGSADDELVDLGRHPAPGAAQGVIGRLRAQAL